MANYYLNDDGTITKKKKKKTGKNYTLQDDGTIKELEDNIAPVKKDTSTSKKSSELIPLLDKSTKSLSLSNLALRTGDVKGINSLKKNMEENQKLKKEYNELKDREEKELVSKTSKKDLANIDRYNKGANVSDNNLGKVFEYADTIKNLKKSGYTLDELKEIAPARKRQTNAEEMEKKKEESANYAKEHEVLGSLMSVPQNLVSGVTGTVDAVSQFLIDPYRKLDVNTDAFSGMQKAAAAREAISEDMSPLAGFIYQTSMSLADSLAAIGTAGVTGLGSLGSLGLMASQSATNTIIDATNRGMTADKALTAGMAAGFFEGFFERVSLGNLTKLSKTNPKGLKQIVTNISESMLVNASEEAATEFANIMFDNINGGSLSNAKLMYDNYISQGMDKEKAQKMVIKDLAMQIGEAGLGGALMGGGFGIAGTVAGKINNRPNDNDNKVIEKETQERAKDKRKTVAIENEVNKRISESEEVNGALSDTEKNNIRKAVEADVESGKFDVTTTELSTKEFDEIRKQVRNDLENGKISFKRVEETLFPEKAQRFNELVEELKTADEDQRESIESELKTIKNGISKIIGSSKHLSKSYEQEILKNTRFERETSADDTELTKLLDKSAARAGLNNTPEAHDTYNLLNKVANDSGTEYVFTSDKELKELGYNLEGRTVNGLVRYTKDGKKRVLINIDSKNALNVIVGHETTHLLKNTESYDKLKNLVIDYAKEKGEYDSRLEELTELYKDTNANIEEELISDLIGEYVFTDEAFVKNLSAKQPNIFQRIYNHIKHLIKMATAGSKEAKQLEQIKNTFDKAYKEMGKTTTSEVDSNLTTDADSDTKYSIYYNSQGGYDGKRMSNRAVEAYENGEMPLSKWNKATLIEAIEENAIENNVEISSDDLRKLTAKELQENFLDNTSWHHTGALYNKTNFYKLNEDAVLQFNEDTLDEIISNRLPIRKLSDEEKKAKQRYKTVLEESKEIYDKLDLIFNSGVIGLSTFAGVEKRWENGKLNLEETYQQALKAIKEKDSSKVKQWEALPEGHWRKEDVELFNNNLSEYAKKQYLTQNARKKTILEKIKKNISNPTSNPDIRYSLSDSQGEKITKNEQANNTEKILNEFGLNSVNDYVHVQKKVLETLGNDFFGEVIVENTGMIVDIGKKGIKETFGPGKRFQTLPRELKLCKLAVVKQLPELIKKAQLVEGDVKNLHGKNKTSMFDYLETSTEINGVPCKIKIDIKKSEVKNKFWMHRVEIKNEQNLNLPYNNSKGINEVSAHMWSIADEDAKNNSDFLLAPTKDYRIYGEDIKLQNDIAPVNKEVVAKNATAEDVAPVKTDEPKDLNEAESKGTNSTDKPVRPLRRTEMKSISRSIKRSYGSTFDPTKDIMRLYNAMHSGKLTDEEAAIRATEIGKDIADNIKTKQVRTAEAQEVLDMLRNSRIKLDVEQISEVSKMYDGYNNYKQSMFGKVIISKNGIDLDTKWQELSEEYPYIFDPDVNPQEQPQELANIISDLQNSYEQQDVPDATEIGVEIYQKYFEVPERRKTHGEIQREKVEAMKEQLAAKGFDLDKILEDAKDKSTFSSVDNTPQRFTEKTFGYEEGQAINEFLGNKVALDESRGIKWLNSITNKKDGLLAQLSKEYNIKPGTKESAAAQMYGEGFFVDEFGDYRRYGDEELAQDFPDIATQNNIKGLANDPRIRKFYDETLDAINESRTRNGYDAIPKRENYFLHFFEMNDFFTLHGIPFNPNDIRKKDLPTELNGVTADLKPGQPYFASANRRMGVNTTYDLLRGIEQYAVSAEPQIYHIDNIQLYRGFRNYIADIYGKTKGLENLGALSEEEQQNRIEKVFDSHLSVYAKHLNEQANILAGKTALIDRGLEGILGRRGITTLNEINRQVGSNMVGFNISSAFTNYLAMVQAIAKLPLNSSIKGFTGLVSNKIRSLNGYSDGFAESDPAIIRRKGADQFYMKNWQKVADLGYKLMTATDDMVTEFIVRAKYDELVNNGMEDKEAHIKAGEWAIRILGDRSKGQMPQIFNSKTLGLFTKFQLEVRNQLDSMLYDTNNEAKVSTKTIQDEKKKNIIKAAKITSTVAQLVIYQHIFGKAFESIAGYNPAFDILGVLITALGFDDDEDSEDTVLDNVEEGFLALIEDLPYSSVLTGGRIPISQALPIKEVLTGKDSYGNEKSRIKTITEAAPYYFMPTGYGQIKKTAKGLSMFDEDNPVAGSYTDSGNLRFAVEDTPINRLQASLFGQWANENARDYLDNERKPLQSKQIEEYKELNIPIKDYWKYKEDLKDKTLEEKFDYIADLDLPVSKKNIMINNVVNRKEKVDLINYDDFSSYEEFDFATKNPEKYSFLESIGATYKEYSASEESKEAYNWAYNNRDKYSLVKAVSGDVVKYREYVTSLNNIKADKDSNGKSISGSRKVKVAEYINSLDADYGAKLILFKYEYPSDDRYNYEIIDYLNNRQDISYQEMSTILTELGFTVDGQGNVRW